MILLCRCKELLIRSLSDHFPYYKKTAHCHELYLHNLLSIIEYEPSLRSDILHLIISKLIILDVNAPREDIEAAENDVDMFEMDEDVEEGRDRMKHPIAHTLDVCMDKILNYFILECHDLQSGQISWDKTKELYQDVIMIFDKVILPTYNIHHVQFVMFSLCTFKSTITEAFLNYLWKKVCSPSVASVMRQTAVCYIASLIARATFVPVM